MKRVCFCLVGIWRVLFMVEDSQVCDIPDKIDVPNNDKVDIQAGALPGFPLAEARLAQELLARGGVIGKVVLVLDGPSRGSSAT